MTTDEQLKILLETTKDLLKVAQMHDKKLKNHDELMIQLVSKTVESDELMIQLAGKTVENDERLAQYFSALEESRQDFEYRINALIDSQIAREDDLRNLKNDVHESLERISRLENRNDNQ